MSNQLTDKQLTLLKESFRIVDTANKNEAIPFEKLLDESFIKNYLQELMESFDTDKDYAVASQFMKRVGFLLAVPTLFSITMWDKKLNVSLSNLYIVPNHVNGTWLPSLYIEDTTVENIEGAERPKKRKELCAELFGNLSKLMDSVAASGSIAKPILWDNTAIYVYWIYENRLIQEAGKQGRSDFDFLLHDLDGSVFIEKKNPLSRVFKEKEDPTQPDETVRLRRTCCFYYECNPNGLRCKTCPLTVND